MEKLNKLEKDMGFVVVTLEKYVKEIIQLKKIVTELSETNENLTEEIANLKENDEYMQSIINAQHNRLDIIEHNINHETHLHEWMRDESVKNAIDFRLTPKEISKGVKNYDDRMLQFNRKRY